MGRPTRISTPADQRDRERRVLQALCQEYPATRLRTAAKRLLGNYKWNESAHLVVFRCLMDLPASNSIGLRERLSGCATRRGFPDVAWEEYFQPAPVSPNEAEKLMRQLSRSARAGTKGAKA